MELTKKQIEMLERCSDGLTWKWFVNAEDDEVLRFLFENRLAQAREDIGTNMICATQAGLSVLEHLHNAQKQCEERAAKEQAEKQANAVEAEKNIAKEFRHDFFVAGFSVLLTLLVEHMADLIKLLDKIITAIGK